MSHTLVNALKATFFSRTTTTKRGSAILRFWITRRTEMRLFLFALAALMFQAQAATPLVAHSDVWNFHKGTNAPKANWTSIADAALNSEWSTGAGGIGYGDAAIIGQGSVVAD